MLTKIAIGSALWAALQFSVADQASEQGKAVLAKAEEVDKMKQASVCAQAKAFGLDDLRRAGLTIECD